MSNEETGDISPKHKRETSKKSHWTLDVEDRSPDRPPSSDVQSHPITHPTDQRYPGMVRKPKLQVNSTYIMDLYTKPPAGKKNELGFPSWCPESTSPGTSCENLMMYGRLYQHFLFIIHPT